MLRYRIAGCLALCGLLATLGCGGGGPKLAEVEGIVKSNGKPVDKIQVEFWPRASGQRSVGVTDASGRYTLTTDDGKKGAAVGAHKVVLRDGGVHGDQFLGRGGEDVDMTKGKKSRIGAKYSDPQSSPLEKTVTDGKNQIDLEATP